MTFETSNATLRPGLLFEGTPPFGYLAVTVEAGALVLARYRRAKRTILQRVATDVMKEATTYRLKVARSRTRVRARLWSGSTEPTEWDLDVRRGGAKPGCFGVLTVHPTDHRAAVLRLAEYRLRVPGVFAATSPTVPFALSGVPVAAADGSSVVTVRAASAIPAHIKFEWTFAPDGDEFESEEQTASVPPFTAATEIAVPAGTDLRWRAVVRSRSSTQEIRTRWYSVACKPPTGPIVLAAASCAQFWEQGRLKGLKQARRAAAAPIRTFVFQGDLGYANNTYYSCYIAAQDFFADRFTRFLADPEFRSLRRKASTTFTLDDHDYGPQNNAWKGDVEEWAIDLWNSMHADASDVGYRDFRIADVHCLTLDNRRYSDQSDPAPDADISRLGAEQFAWMETILRASDAGLFLIFSAGIFASRVAEDCFWLGWRREYDRAMTLFHDIQLSGRRVVVVSGDAHGFRVHHHRDPARRLEAERAPVVELICAGLQARTWSPAAPGDPTLDTTRNVMDVSGLGLIAVDPPDGGNRTLTLRAIGAEQPAEGTTPDLFRPLVLPFRP